MKNGRVVFLLYLKMAKTRDTLKCGELLAVRSAADRMQETRTDTVSRNYMHVPKYPQALASSISPLDATEQTPREHPTIYTIPEYVLVCSETSHHILDLSYTIINSELGRMYHPKFRARISYTILNSKVGYHVPSQIQS